MPRILAAGLASMALLESMPQTDTCPWKLIPADLTTEEFLKKFRHIMNTHSNVKVEKGTCHDEPHKRYRKSADQRERHKHLALVANGPFAHKKIAEAFYQEYGLRISFSFKLSRFVGNLTYLMEAGKKPSSDVDRNPAKWPPDLNLEEELKAAAHPGDAEPKEGKKRKRLTFDEVSNVIIEGVGHGPLRTAKDLESAAREMKKDGKVELWNYLGELKSATETTALLSKVWRLWGSLAHPFFFTKAPYKLSQFQLDQLAKVKEWRQGKYKTHVLVLSGEGGYGKTNLAESLAADVAADGYFFIDDPDDFRELDGLIVAGKHAIVVDELTLSAMPVNEVKKMFDLEKTRRVRCRHFNGTLPKDVPRIFCTNSSEAAFYPHFPSNHDRTGVMRRQLFQIVEADLRKVVDVSTPAAASSSSSPALEPTLQTYLVDVCKNTMVARHSEAVQTAAANLGVALVAEVKEVATEIADKVGMARLERNRFLAYFLQQEGQQVDPFAENGLSIYEDVFSQQSVKG